MSRLILFVLISFVCTFSRADVVYQRGLFTVCDGYAPHPNITAPTAELLCSRYAAAASAAVDTDICHHASIHITSVAADRCIGYSIDSLGNVVNQEWDFSVSGNECPAGQKWDDAKSRCIADCPAGTHAGGIDSALCLPDCIGDQTQQADGSCRCKSGQTVTGSWQFGTSGDAGNCSNGCTYRGGGVSFCPSGVSAALGFKDAASVTCYGRFTSTGDICGSNAPNRPNIPVSVRPPVPADTSGTGSDGATPDPKNTPSNSADPNDCASAGGSYGVFNGVGKCLTSTGDNSMDRVKTDKKSTTTTNADGTKTETTETTTTTTGPNGQTVTDKSTTTVTRDSSGNITGTSTGKSTGTGNSDGDGSGKTDCDKYPNSLGCIKAGDIPSDSSQLEKKEVGPQSISVVPLNSSAQCPADIPFPHGIQFSFDLICMYAEGIKPVIIIMAWLSVAFLIFGIKEA